MNIFSFWDTCLQTWPCTESGKQHWRQDCTEIRLCSQGFRPRVTYANLWDFESLTFSEDEWVKNCFPPTYLFVWTFAGVPGVSSTAHLTSQVAAWLLLLPLVLPAFISLVTPHHWQLAFPRRRMYVMKDRQQSKNLFSDRSWCGDGKRIHCYSPRHLPPALKD